MSDMIDKVALITGASSGIGQATAEAFAAKGAKCAGEPQEIAQAIVFRVLRRRQLHHTHYTDARWRLDADGLNPPRALSNSTGDTTMKRLALAAVALILAVSVHAEPSAAEEARTVVETVYTVEVYKATGKALDIPFVHSWTVQDGQLIAFQQYTDTAALVAAKTPPLAGASVAQGQHHSRAQWFEQVALFPADRSLMRPEDGVILGDGTLLVADQVHGLVALDHSGAKRPFGDFKAAGYVHEPPSRSGGPNGVALEPDGAHVLVADVFTGAIYRVNTGNEHVERVHLHEFGVNAALRDSTGALWFTQSTQNKGPDSEARMFAAVDSRPSDGALFRIAPATAQIPGPAADLKASGLEFANGLAIDEARGQLYVAETMADRIIGYRLSVATGELSEGRVIANVPTPDNIELDASGRLWVASPIANSLLVVDPESGEWSTAFHPQTAEHARLMIEWKRRGESGEPRLELFGPDMWSPMPGLVTGMILAPEGGPIYLTGLGDSLVKLQRSSQESEGSLTRGSAD